MRRILNAGVSNYHLPIKSVFGAVTVYKSNGNSKNIISKKNKGIRKLNQRSSRSICGVNKLTFIGSENKIVF